MNGQPTAPSYVISADDPRLRIIHMYRLLAKYTDRDHPLSTNQIRDIMLREHGITMHRTTVYNDIEVLRKAGVDVVYKRSTVNLYYLGNRHFEDAELKLLLDAVGSSKFITEKKSKALAEKLIAFSSDFDAGGLRRHVYTVGRAKSENELGYAIVDAIHEGINKGKQISFQYTEYSPKKRLVMRNGGKPYTVSPYMLVWNGDYYYLVGYYHEKDRVNIFRVDRIRDVPRITEDAAVPAPAGFDIGRYTTEVFRMYDSEELVEVELLCENAVMKGVVDQFGKKVRTWTVDEEHFGVRAQVCVTPTFYAWIFQWCGQIRILGPAEILEGYQGMIETVWSSIQHSQLND